jgi:CO dehydrogenase/acetyl-CoA synthase delta subunit
LRKPCQWLKQGLIKFDKQMKTIEHLSIAPHVADKMAMHLKKNKLNYTNAISSSLFFHFNNQHKN